MHQSLRLAACALGSILLSQAAQAADVYRPAPPLRVIPTAAPTWSGFYLGAAAGYAWQHPTLSFSGLPLGVTSPGATYDMNRLFLDGTIGADWQVGGNLVFGLLADAEWGPKSNDQTVTLTSLGPAPPAGVFPFPTTLTTGMTYDVLARIGLAAGNTAMIYGLAGWTWQKNSFNYTDPNGGGVGVPISYTYGANVNGWTVGIGAESKLNQVVSLKAEYRYTRFGSPSAGLTGNSFGIGTVALRSNEQRVLAGLNFRFFGI